MTTEYHKGDGPYEKSPFYSKKERTLRSALIYALDGLKHKDYNLDSEAGRRMLAEEISKAMTTNKRKTPWWYRRTYFF